MSRVTGFQVRMTLPLLCVIDVTCGFWGTATVPVPVVKDQVALVVLVAPSLATAYHSYSVFGLRPGHEMEALLPLATPVTVPMSV